MKLIFSRENDTIVTQLEIDGNIEEFDYLFFINKLIEAETLEESEYPEDATEAEKEEISNMLKKINEAIVPQVTDDAEDTNTLEA